MGRMVDARDHVHDRGLAAAGGAGDQDEPTRFGREVPQHRRHTQGIQGGNVLRDQAEGGADGAALHEAVDAEPRDPGYRVGEVELLVVLEALSLVVVEDAEDHLAGLLAVEDGEPVHRLDPALVSHRRWEARGEMDIGRLGLDHASQHL